MAHDPKHPYTSAQLGVAIKVLTTLVEQNKKKLAAGDGSPGLNTLLEAMNQSLAIALHLMAWQGLEVKQHKVGPPYYFSEGMKGSGIVAFVRYDSDEPDCLPHVFLRDGTCIPPAPDMPNGARFETLVQTVLNGVSIVLTPMQAYSLCTQQKELPDEAYGRGLERDAPKDAS